MVGKGVLLSEDEPLRIYNCSGLEETGSIIVESAIYIYIRRRKSVNQTIVNSGYMYKLTMGSNYISLSHPLFHTHQNHVNVEFFQKKK